MATLLPLFFSRRDDPRINVGDLMAPPPIAHAVFHNSPLNPMHRAELHGGTAFIKLAWNPGRGCGYHGDTLRVVVLPFDEWRDAGRPWMVQPVNNNPGPMLVQGFAPELVSAATAGASSGYIHGAAPALLAHAPLALDGVTPQVWAVEDDRRYVPAAGGKRGWSAVFRVIAVV